MRHLSFAALLLCPALAFAQVPEKLGYQGRLLKADGTPESGVVDVDFALFDSAEGGAALWSEQQHIAMADGFYSTHLGAVKALPPTVFDGAERFLEVTVRGTALSPRQRVTSVPYALMCTDARNVTGGSVSASSLTVAGHKLTDASGKLDPKQLGGCQAADQVLKWDGSTWACGTVGQASSAVSVTAPLTGTGEATKPLSMAAATGAVDGYLKAGDFASFASKVGSLAPGAGIEIGGTSAAPSVAVASVGCSAGQALRYDGTTWACANLPAAGAGLTLKSDSYSLLDSCAAGQSLAWSGTAWSCADGPKAGSGLTYKSGEFSLLDTCGPGQVLEWSGSAWVCSGGEACVTLALSNRVGTSTKYGRFALPFDCAPPYLDPAFPTAAPRTHGCSIELWAENHPGGGPGIWQDGMRSGFMAIYPNGNGSNHAYMQVWDYAYKGVYDLIAPSSGEILYNTHNDGCRMTDAYYNGAQWIQTTPRPGGGWQDLGLQANSYTRCVLRICEQRRSAGSYSVSERTSGPLTD